jgi:hypothetical protein
MWKVIGAKRSVISWIAYGCPMRFIREPPRTFSTNNTFSIRGHENFLKKDLEANVKEGLFRKASPDELHIVNPLKVVVNGGSGKVRN